MKGDKLRMEEKVIEEKIAADAYKKWPYGDEPKNVEDAKAVTGNSEVAAVEGIVKTLGLEESVITKLIGHKKENGEYEKSGEIYTKTSLSPEIVSEIKKAMEQGEDTNKCVLKILSNIHDAWVKKNSDNFLKPNRNKERQFVSLQLLDWGEVESDLVFLKPILAEAGIQIDEESLRQEHEIQQQEYFIDNNIFSHEDLVNHLKNSSRYYPALEGVETKNGGNILALLQNPEVLEKMAGQIESKVHIKSKEEFALDIIKSDNPQYDDVYHIKTVENDFNIPNIDKYISKREILLSKLIGKPYPTYVINGLVSPMHDNYKTEISDDVGTHYGADVKSASIAHLRGKNEKIEEEGRIGKIEFGHINLSDKMDGALYVTDKDLLASGLDPQEIGWEEIAKETVNRKEVEYENAKKELSEMQKGLNDPHTINRLEQKVELAKQAVEQAKQDYDKYIVTPKDMAKADEKKALTQKEVGKVQRFFDKILGRDNKENGKDEK